MKPRGEISWIVAVIITLLIALVTAGCGGGNNGSAGKEPAGVQVQFTSPSSGQASLDQGQSVTISVSVTDDPGNQGVTWSLQASSGKPVGKLSNAAATSATYVAPASVTKSKQLTVVATSVADPSVTASLPVSVEPPPQIASSSPTPVSIGCPAAGTVIPGVGPLFGTVWTAGVNSGLTYYLEATGGVTPYTWKVLSGTLPPGLTLGTPTSGQTVIFGNPTSSGCWNITLQLTDATGVSVTAPYYLLVIPPSLSVQQPPIAVPQVGISYPPTALTVTGGIPPYSWSVNPNGPLPPNLTLTSSAQNSQFAAISGVPTSAGAGQSFSVDILVSDGELPYPAIAQPVVSFSQISNPDPSCHTGSESNLTAQGPYAFLLRGFDTNGPVVIAGNFTVDGAGNVTGGVEDVNRSSGVQTNLNILSTGSSYTLGGDNRGCLTLANSAGQTVTFRLAAGTCSTSANLQGGCENGGYFTRGRILEDDPASGTRASGILRLQDSSSFSNSGFSGRYAFGFSGWDFSAGRYAIAGSLEAAAGNSGQGTLNSIAADINDAGTLSSALSGGSGTYTVGPNGRGTITLSVGPASFDMAFYIISSSSEAIFAATDALSAAHPLLSGEAVSAPGPFTVSALQNTYLLRMAGLSSGVPDPNIGVLTFDGVGALKGTVYENDGGVTATNAIAGNYAVQAGIGRLTFTAAQANQSLGPHPLVAYLASPASGVGAFLISTDSSAQAGLLEFQNLNPAVTTFSDLSLEGPRFLGTDEDLDASTWNFAGTALPNGNGGGAGCLCDVSGPGASGLVTNERFAASYSINSKGAGSFGGETVAVTNGATTFYIDESPLDTHPAITVVEQ